MAFVHSIVIIDSPSTLVHTPKHMYECLAGATNTTAIVIVFKALQIVFPHGYGSYIIHYIHVHVAVLLLIYWCEIHRIMFFVTTLKQTDIHTTYREVVFQIVAFFSSDTKYIPLVGQLVMVFCKIIPFIPCLHGLYHTILPYTTM